MVDIIQCHLKKELFASLSGGDENKKRKRKNYFLRNGVKMAEAHQEKIFKKVSVKP